MKEHQYEVVSDLHSDCKLFIDHQGRVFAGKASESDGDAIELKATGGPVGWLIQKYHALCMKTSTHRCMPAGPIPDARYQTPAQQSISDVCGEIKEMLLDKNRKYGNSALEPLRLFSKADAVEQINVRIDDKLSRLRSAQLDEDEDVVRDLIGYLVLRLVTRKQALGAGHRCGQKPSSHYGVERRPSGSSPGERCEYCGSAPGSYCYPSCYRLSAPQGEAGGA